MGGIGSGKTSSTNLVQEVGREISVVFDSDVMQKTNRKQALAFRAAMSNQFDEILYGGAYRGGKSYLLAMVAVAKALTIEGSKSIITSYRLAQLKGQIWPIVLDVLPKELIESSRENPTPRAKLKNGSEIIGIPANDPMNFRGYNDVAFVGADEANLIPEACFPEIKARFSRPKDALWRPLLLCTCNPSAGYIKKHYITEVKNPATTKFIQATVFDNEAIDHDEYARQMIAEHGENSRHVRRYLYGDWNTFEGQVFEQFDPHLHTDDFELDPRRYYTRVCGMDYGLRNPTVIAYIAMDSDGVFYIYDELHVRETLPNGIQEAHEEKCRAHHLAEDEATPFADPTMWQRDKSTGVAPAEVFEIGLTNGKHMPLHKANNSYRGVTTLQSLLAQNRLVVHSRCQHIIAAFSEFRYRPETNTQQLRGETSEDYDKHMKDPIDAVRYAINQLMPPDRDYVYMSGAPRQGMLYIENPEDEEYEVDPAFDRLAPSW